MKRFALPLAWVALAVLMVGLALVPLGVVPVEFFPGIDQGSIPREYLEKYKKFTEEIQKGNKDK